MLWFRLIFRDSKNNSNVSCEIWPRYFFDGYIHVKSNDQTFNNNGCKLYFFEYFFECPCWSHLCNVFRLFILFTNLNSAMIEKNKVKIWTPCSPPRVALNYWITLTKYLLCKITHLYIYNVSNKHVIKFFPLKTARRKETDNMGKHNDSRRIPHRGAHMQSVKSKYLPLIAEKDSCQDKLTSFWTIWMSLNSFPALRVKVHIICTVL